MTWKFRALMHRLHKILGQVSALQIIVLVFLCIILTGALLLTLPFASKSG